MTGKRKTCTCTNGVLCVAALLGLLATPTLATDMPLTGTSSLTTCSDTFYDSGGSGAMYQSYEDGVFTYIPDTPGMNIRVTFISFNTEAGWDYLYVYDGPTTSDPLVATLDGTTLPGTITSSAAGGELTFEFYSDSGGQRDGWEATIDCVAPPTTGACCLTDGSCLDLDETACNSEALFYRFEGLGTDCASANCPTAGSFCDLPISVTDAFTLSDTTQHGDNYDDTCLESYDSDQDAIIEWVVTADGCYDIMLDPGTMAYTGFAIDDVCPVDSGASDCMAKSTLSSAAVHGVSTLNLTAGTYYIHVSSYLESPYYFPFTLTATPCPAGGACCHADGSCTDEADEAACIAAGGTFQGPGTACATTVCPQPPPANDDCADAIIITPGMLPYMALNVNVIDATDDANVDPSCDSSYNCGVGPANNGVWYVFTPVADCIATIDQTGIDAATSIWTGVDCNSLVELTCSDPDPIDVFMSAGTQYWILISNWTCASEPSSYITFEFDTAPPPTGGCCYTDGTCGDAVAEGACDAAGGTYLGDDVLCATANCNGACCLLDGTCYDTNQDACEANVDFLAFGGMGTECLTYSCPVVNDECENAVEITNGSILQDNAEATTSDDAFGCGIGKDLWFKYTVVNSGSVLIDTCGTYAIDGYDTELAVYLGCPASDDDLLDCDDDCSGDDDPPAICKDEDQTGSGYTRDSCVCVPEAIAGQTLYIKVGHYSETTSDSSLIVVSVEEGACEPPRGACCTLAECLAELTEPACLALDGMWLGEGVVCGVDSCFGACCLPNQTCEETSMVSCTVNPDGNYLGDGTTCSPINPCALGACCVNGVCTDDVSYDDCINTMSGWYLGDASVCEGAICNDECGGAIAIGDVVGLAWDNTDATTNDPGTHTINKDLWYCYTASCTGIATVGLCDTAWDTKLAVWEGCVCPPTVELAYNDDNAVCNTPDDDNASSLTVDVVAGQQYLIQVGSFSDNFGPGLLDVSCEAYPEGRCCMPAEYFIYGLDQCQNLNSHECEAVVGGIFTEGVTCEEEACPTGRCCYQAIESDVWVCAYGLAAEEYGEATCLSGDATIDLSTISWAQGESCTSSPCDMGACCLMNGACEDLTEESCTEHAQFFEFQGLGTTCLTVVCPQPPANDDCATAIVVGDGMPAAEGDNSLASDVDDAEATCQANSNKDVWYVYTATCTGIVTVGTDNSGQSDTVLNVFDACGGNEIACDDDDGVLPANSSLLTFEAIQGDVVYIRVASYNEGYGDYDLNISCEPACFTCPGDINNDEKVNGDDIQCFVDCLVGAADPTTCNCACGDFSDPADGVIDMTDVAPFVDALLNATGPCEPGRCCYIDAGVGACDDTLTEVECLGLGGVFAAGLNCIDDPCPMGRCCYGDPQAPSCADEMEIECLARADEIGWDEGLNCIDDPCPISAEGDNCAFPYVIPTLPFNTTDTTCGRVDDYNATCMGSYDGDEDMIFELTLEAETCVKVTMTPGFDQRGDPNIATWTGIGVDDSCPFDASSCLGTVGNSGSEPRILTGTLPAGTYYIMVDVWPSPTECFAFDLVVEECPVGACCTALACVSDMPEADCVAAGGEYQGDASICEASTCFGACCLENEVCDVRTIVSCGLASGIYQGDGTTCDPNPCALGACCKTDGTCEDAMTSVDCEAVSGTFMGGASTCATVVCNDDCTTALVVTDGRPAYEGDNTNATDDGLTLTCEYTTGTSHDVWFAYTATCDGLVTVDTENSTLSDTIVAVYDACGGNEIACDDDGGETPALSALASFEAVYGTTYYIRVASTGTGSGEYDLNIACNAHIECQLNDVLEGELECSVGYVDNFNGGCFSDPAVFSSIACGDIICGTSGTWTIGDTNYRDTDWFEITVAADTELTFQVLETEFPVTVGLIENYGVATCPAEIYLTPGVEVPAFGADSFTACVPAGTYWFLVAPTNFTGVPCGAKYRVQLTCDTCVVPTGACCDPLTGGCTPAMTEFACLAAGGVYNGDDTVCDPNPCPQPITNDDCSSATVAADGDNAYDNTGATLDGAVVAPSDTNMHDDIWYSYTATCTGDLIVGTCEGDLSDEDTVLEVYSGSDCATMVSVGSGDDDCGSGYAYASEVTVTGVTIGDTFLIRLSGYNGGTVSGLLNITCAP